MENGGDEQADIEIANLTDELTRRLTTRDTVVSMVYMSYTHACSNMPIFLGDHQACQAGNSTDGSVYALMDAGFSIMQLRVTCGHQQGDAAPPL